MNINCNRNILLLGAGFTKNFGGLLADEMWAEIFHHKKVQEQPRIKRKMLEDLDYESSYYSILKSNSFTDDEKTAMVEATKSAYAHIDNILKQRFEHRQSSEWENNIDKLLYDFSKSDKHSFIFTLNQDLFIERFYQNPSSSSLYANAILSIPGIKVRSNWFMNRTGFLKYHSERTESIVTTKEEIDQYYNLKPEDFHRLPSKDDLDNMLKIGNNSLLNDGNYFLIKLHGSYDWISSSGNSAMVIGRGKNKKIKNEPLLNYYFDIFKEVLSQNGHRLLIIGYGFGDKHINHEISKAVKNCGLEIYVLSPERTKDLKYKLCQGPDISKDTKTIWNGLSGHFQCIEDILLDRHAIEDNVKKKHFYDLFFESE